MATTQNPKIHLQAKARLVASAPLAIWADGRVNTFLEEMGEMKSPTVRGEDLDGRATVMEWLRNGPRDSAVVIVVGDSSMMHAFLVNKHDHICVDSLNGNYTADHNYVCTVDGQRLVLKVLGLIDVYDFMEHHHMAGV
jgi:hypothetical protein